MSDLIIARNEKDLFVYLQKNRLLIAKKLNEENIERTKNVKEEKTTFKGFMKNVGNFFERGANSYDKKDESIDKALKDFEEKNPEVIDLTTAEGLIESLFQDDKYGLAKLVFASSVILDDEYEYKYVDEGLKDASVLLYQNEETLLTIKKQLFENYNAISPKSLTSVQKGILAGVAITTAVGLVGMPLLLAPGAIALSAHGLLGAVTLESVLMSAAITGIVYGGMKLYNNEAVKAEFRKLAPEKNALYLAIQCTYIERIKTQLDEEEFKEQLDTILKNLSTLKGDLDYYLFVEQEETKDNKEKIKSFHKFDDRLSKVLGI